MIATNNNPLGRLHNILLRISKEYSDSPYTVLSNVFNIDDEDNRGAIIASYSELFKLCEEARELIIKLPINHDKFLSPINEAVLALSKVEFTSDIGASRLKKSIDDKLLTTLDLSSEMLSYSYKEPELEEAVLEDLSNNLIEIKNMVIEGNLNNELKDMIIKNLDNIDMSIKKYKLYGVSGIKSSLTSTIGDIVINNNLVMTDDEKSIIEQILGFMSKINTVISFSKNLTPLIPSIIKLLN